MKKHLLLIFFFGIFPKLFSQTFTDITNQAGIQVQLPAMGDLVVWLDYDNDGWLDFFGGTEYETFLYRNNGDGTFSNTISGSGLETIFPRAVAIGDCDNDGFDDLLISSFNNTIPAKVYKNMNGAGFSEIFSALEGNNSHRAIWLDFNADGLIDFISSSIGGISTFYVNKGNCQFEASSEITGFNVGNSPVAGDYNNDGLQDIFIGIMSTTKTNRLFKNIAGSAIQDITYSAGLSDFRNCVAAAWGDMDNDGFLDLYIGNIGSNRNVFFYNKGNSTFEDRTIAAGISDAGDARTCTWQDINNDGWIDLFTTNHTANNKLFINNQNGTFTNMAALAGIDGPSDGFGLSWGDFDKDGDLDALICGHSYGVVLLRNELNNSNSFLNLKLIGVHDNKSAIGSRITLYSNGTKQIREVFGGSGATGQDAFEQHFGLGQQTVLDSVLIRWPSGAIQKLFNISANQHLIITQEGNIPPTRFRLISPSPDTVYQSQAIKFSWQASSDPDSPDPVYYHLHIATPQHDTLIGPVTENFILIQMQPWMSNDSCYWKVSATDGIDITQSWDRFQLHYDYQTSLFPDGHDIFNDFSVATSSLDPTGGILRLEFNSAIDQSVVCKIYDLTGRLFSSQILEVSSGGSVHLLPLNCETVAAILSLETRSKKIRLKVVRQNY